MRLVSVRQEAHYRGFRIEGVKENGGTLLRVVPMRPGLPYLIYSRFRTLRAPWTKAVDVVCGYIDEAFKSRLAQPLSKESGGGSLHPQPIVEPHLDELLQLQAQLLSELSQPDEHPTPKAGPVRKALRLAGGKDHYD